jgi:hypothetical protein
MPASLMTLRAWLVAAAVVLAVLAAVRALRARAPVHEELARDDQAVLEELARAGSRLDQPHPIDHFLYFPSEERAARAAEMLRRDGFTTRVDAPLGGTTSWKLTATRAYVPTAGAITSTRRRMNALAASLGGEFDGWESPVVR